MEIGEHRFFKGFPQEAIDLLRKDAEIVELSPSQMLFSEGDAPDGVYLVLDGEINIVKAGADGAMRTLATLPSDAAFGEMGVFDQAPRSAGAQATGAASVKLARIPGELLMETLAVASGQTVVNFIQPIFDRLRQSNSKYMNDIVRKEKMSLIGEMANTIIHDIRGPFQSVQLGSELLLEMHGDDATKDICRMIGLQINRVAVMAEELLEFSRGTSKLTMETVDLHDLLDEFQFLNKDLFHDKQIPITFESSSVFINADRHKLMRTVQNIVNNALDALKGKPEVVIRVITGLHEGMAQIRIIDNGPGIPEQIRARLFEPFVTHGKKNGTGLGMAIVKSVVEAHQGKIFFETETGKGTTFFIQIPVQEIPEGKSLAVPTDKPMLKTYGLPSAPAAAVSAVAPLAAVSPLAPVSPLSPLSPVSPLGVVSPIAPINPPAA
jgi:signal transduction histidine kinase